jgi:hypothetical protein
MTARKRRKPGPPIPMAERWAEPIGLAATPPDATVKEELRLRFPAVPPREGTADRILWDALGMDQEDDNDTEGER